MGLLGQARLAVDLIHDAHLGCGGALGEAVTGAPGPKLGAHGDGGHCQRSAWK